MKAKGKQRKSAGTRAHLTEHVPMPQIVGNYKVTATAYMPGPLPWTRKVRQKLHRQEFPELTAGRDKLSEGRWLSRALMARLRTKTTSERETLRESGFGEYLNTRLARAVWAQDAAFLAEFTAGLQMMPEKRDAIADLYDWLLENSAKVEGCRTVAEIVRLLPVELEVSQKSFERICREVGLPLARKVTTGSPPKRRQRAVKLPLSSHAKHGSGNRRREKARR
jgi:hypothetical protein